jgi:hypothetical protein
MRIAITPRITARFGDIDPAHPQPHNGIDAALPIGSSIYAPAGGVVSRVADYGDAGLGKAVFLKTNAGSQYIFGHLSEIKVHPGERVHTGDLLALSGNTGNSTGPHLHLGLVSNAGAFQDPQLGILGKVVQKGIESAREQAEHKAYDIALGILDALRDLLVDLSYSIALVGSGLCILFHVAGWKGGGRWAGILTLGYVLVRYLLG